jgi:hypothetical protein
MSKRRRAELLRAVASQSTVGSEVTGGSNMHANKGDHLIVEGKKIGTQSREGEIVEVRGEDGAPPYVVRWTDGHEGLTYPGPDAHVLPEK